jgi:hypothetical protein
VSSGRFLIKSTEEYLPQGLVTPSRKDKEAKKSMLNLFPTSQSLKILEQKRDRESSKLKLFSPSFRKIIKNNMTGNPYSINQVFFFFIVILGVYCGIYKGSYNISTTSYWNLPPPLFSFSHMHHSWNSFNRSHFSNYKHVYDGNI